MAEKTTITTHNYQVNTDINFFDDNGQKIYLDMFEDKTIILTFWASWCGGCMQEIITLDHLQKDFRKTPLEVIAISEDKDGLGLVQKYFAQHEIRHLRVFYDHNHELFRAMGVVGMPTSYLINQQGMIKLIFKGNTKWHNEDIRSMIVKEMGGIALPKNTFTESMLNRQFINKSTTNKSITNKLKQVDQDKIESNKAQIEPSKIKQDNNSVKNNE